MSNKNKIGFWAVFGIVTGSQIGAGVFTLPACLAPYGIFGLFGCILSGIGAITLCLVFATLCAKLPKTGGPHVYVKYAFGDQLAFFSGWTYWVISWVSNTIVVITSISYLSPLLMKLFGDQIFFIKHHQLIYLCLELFLLFIIAWLNLKGVKFSGNLEFILTILKFIPLIILPIAALKYFNRQHFVIDTNITNLSTANILGKVTLLSLWGFIGLETATTPAGSVINPGSTIPQAIIIGTLSVALLYLLNFIGVMGLIPGKQLLNSNAPYVDVAQYIFGGNWHLLISILASIVCVGTLNAWILTSSQISLGLAMDGLMPKIFTKLNKDDAPIYGVIISCIGIVPLLILTANNNLYQQVISIIDISVIAFVFVYTLSVISLIKILYQENNKSIIKYLIAILALLFCGWILTETPKSTILLSSLFILSGIPVFWLRYYSHKKFFKIN